MKRISLSFRNIKIDYSRSSKKTIIAWIALICSILGIVSNGIIFVPIAFFFSLISILTGQFFLGVLSLFLSVFGLFVSPSLWILIGKIVLFLYISWGQVLGQFLHFMSPEGLDI